MREIRGKTALVTGAASGIGRAISLRLADEGARLYLLDVNAVELARVVLEAKRRGVDALGRHCDVSQPSQNSAAIHHLLDQFGGVLSVGTGLTRLTVERYPRASWSWCWRVDDLSLIDLWRELAILLLGAAGSQNKRDQCGNDGNTKTKQTGQGVRGDH